MKGGNKSETITFHDKKTGFTHSTTYNNGIPESIKDKLKDKSGYSF